MRYIFLHFHLYFSLQKKFLFSKKNFRNKTFFFHIKTFFSANNVYFVKNKSFSKKKNFFFNLVLQQMSNRSRLTAKYFNIV